MFDIRSLLLLSFIPFVLCSCTNTGGYFQHDGPPSSTWGERDFSNAPNAIPRVEKPHKAANRPYRINGVKYTPMTGDAPLTQTGIGSWYGKQFHGNKTSIGETYDMFAMTAAHTTMELPSYAKVTNLENGKTVIVRVNDRGPFLHNRVIDLSYAAASKLGYVKKGTARVKVERIRRADIQSGRFVTPGNIQLVESSNQTNEKQADLVALESIISDATAQEFTTTIDAIGSIESGPVTVEESSTTGLSIEESNDNLSGAIDLTEVAKNGEMVSTETVQITPEKTSKLETQNWSIQAGIYSNKSNAIARIENLKKVINQPIEIFEDNGRYRVLIGQFKDQKTAANEANAIGSLLNEKFFTFEQK